MIGSRRAGIVLIVLSTAAAACGGSSTLSPSKASNTGFLGTWTNVNPATRGNTRADIRQDGSGVAVHMWGACEPVDCDWGEATTSTSDAADGVLEVDWHESFIERRMQLSLNADGLLRVATQSHYIDSSGRPDSSTIEFFARDR